MRAEYQRPTGIEIHIETVHGPRCSAQSAQPQVDSSNGGEAISFGRPIFEITNYDFGFLNVPGGRMEKDEFRALRAKSAPRRRKQVCEDRHAEAERFVRWQAWKCVDRSSVAR